MIDGRRLSTGRTGVGRYLEILLKTWAANEFPSSDNLIALSSPYNPEFLDGVDGVELEILHPKEPGLFWERFGLSRNLRSTDLLFAPANLIPGNWRGPTVLTIHDVLQKARPSDFAWHTRLRFGRRYQQAAQKADRILVPSDSTAADVVKYYNVPRDRIRTIYPAPGEDFGVSENFDLTNRNAIPELAGKPYFLFVGKRSKRRHLPEVLEAFQSLRQQSAEHRLVLVGPGKTDRVEPGIIQAGHVPDSTLSALYTGATALLYPSEYEGFGLPVVEAMASGCPVVTLRNSALIEVGGDAPLYLDRPDADSLFHAMRLLSSDSALRKDHIARGFVQAARFRVDRFASEVRDELRAFLAPS